MNTQLTLVVCAAWCLWVPLKAGAVTKQWESASVSNMVQVVADGKGGCAFAWQDSSNKIHVTWLDAKGGVIYDSSSFSAMFAINIIERCTPKQLIFNGVVVFPSLIIVTSKGVAIPVISADGLVIGSPMAFSLPRHEFSDSKGFFVINRDAAGTPMRLVRFTYK